MRKKRAEKRLLKPDPKFNDIMVSRFINTIMYDGKKSEAETLFILLLILLKIKQKKLDWKFLKKH